MIADEELRALNQRGLIPGPGEKEEAYLERVRALQQLSPPAAQMPLPDEDWKEARARTRELFDFSVDWVPAFYSNADLPFWQGAAVWISGYLPVIQLKKGFRTGSYLRWYAREEVLAHEAAHAARSAFHEPRFEEILAYATSKSSWRRWLGPLFRHSWESYLCVFLLLLSLSIQTALLFYESNPLLEFLLYLPWLFMLGLLARLSYHHLLLQRCLRQIAPLLKNPSQALAVIFRLTDEEIVDFGKRKSDGSLRSRVLGFYFKEIKERDKKD